MVDKRRWTDRGARGMLRAALVALGVWAVVGSAAPTVMGQSAEVEKIREQLAGSYRLVWYRSYDRDGKETVLPYTVGQISYDRAGRMSAQLMRENHKRFASTPPTEQERATAFSNFISYFGAYDIDPVKRSVTHHVQGAVNPNMVGSDLTRFFEFSPDGKSLFLTVKDGERIVGRLQWDKYR